MYKIGEFSKIVDIPVRTLRYYAEDEILIPSEVDRFTGYKYYSDENISECELIKLLKSLDFTLDEIKMYKDCLNELEERMYLLKLKYKRLSYMQKELDNQDNCKLFKQTNKEKVLRRKYEKGIIRKNN